jgi:hypothetical protein
VTPFTFTQGQDVGAAKREMERFEGAAKAWKPSGFNTEAELKLDYYLDRQLADTQLELAKAFPETSKEITPVMLPLTSCFVNEQARVFLDTTVLDLVDQDGNAVDAKLAAWWKATKEEMGLSFRLKNVDRYTTLHRTCFLRLGRVGAKLQAQIFFAQRVDVAFDPAFPFDLDMAYGVRLEIGREPGSEVLAPNGQQATPDAKRYEFWCGRPGAELYALVDSNGKVERADKNPFGQVVPLVMFTAHTEELGPFVTAKQGLHLFNRAVNVAASDEQHIARCQGYGQFFLSAPELASGGAPGKLVAGPSKIVPLPPGYKVSVENGKAPLADLQKRLDASVKRAAVLHGIPPGTVSLEARAVASGIALQIEMRPLLEIRTDAVEVYQGPVRRVWTVLRAVHNATRQGGEKEIPDTVAMRWKPGDVQMPVDPHIELDDIIIKLTNNLITRAKALAILERIPLEEAKKLAAEIATENKADTGLRAGLTPLYRDARLEGADITGNAKATLAAPGAQRNGAAAAAG